MSSTTTASALCVSRFKVRMELYGWTTTSLWLCASFKGVRDVSFEIRVVLHIYYCNTLNCPKARINVFRVRVKWIFSRREAYTAVIRHLTVYQSVRVHGSIHMLTWVAFGKTEYVWISFLGKRSFSRSSRYEPIPDPVPPAIECDRTNPCHNVHCNTGKTLIINN